MFTRLYKFLDYHKCLYKLQYGFRTKHSTSHAVLSMVQEIRETIENGEFAVGVFVDFKKAFDTVNHAILLKKMEHFGIRGLLNQWFRSYLSNRKQYVSIDDIDSSFQTSHHGVPQGSVLGPLLFLIYINDLNQCIRNSTTRHFADDTNIIHKIQNKQRNRNPFRKLNSDLRSLTHWLLANKISLNKTKTEVVVFRKKGTDIPSGNIILNGLKLEYQHNTKYVGLILDEHLTFKPHIDNLNARLKRANNLLSISRHYVPKEVLLQIYYGQFNSILTYGSQVWIEANDLQSTIILQKKALRIISWSDFQAHSYPLFKEFKILKLTDVTKMNNLLFVHDILSNKAPVHFHDYFQMITRQHPHNTINNPTSIYSVPNGSLKLPDIRNQQSAKTVKYSLAKLWNDFVKELARSENYSSLATSLHSMSRYRFKRLIRTHLSS